jgi:hypothetical protein
MMTVTCNAQTLPVNGGEFVPRPLIFLADVCQEVWVGVGVANDFCVVVSDCLVIQ